MKKASAQNFKGESMLPRYHLDLHAKMPCISVIRYRGSGGLFQLQTARK